MPSEVSICNEALNSLGQQTIVSLEDGSQSARICKQFYASSRDAYLTKHPWSFATKISPLAEITLPDGYDNYYSYGYSYPARCLKIRSVKDENSKDTRVYEIKTYTESGGGDRRIILSNTNPAWVEFTLQVTDPLIFIPAFAESLSGLLAAKMAMPLTRNLKVKQDSLRDFAGLHNTAVSADSSSQMLKTPQHSWVRGRRFNDFYSPNY